MFNKLKVRMYLWNEAWDFRHTCHLFLSLIAFRWETRLFFFVFFSFFSFLFIVIHWSTFLISFLFEHFALILLPFLCSFWCIPHLFCLFFLHIFSWLKLRSSLRPENLTSSRTYICNFKKMKCLNYHTKKEMLRVTCFTRIYCILFGLSCRLESMLQK